MLSSPTYLGAAGWLTGSATTPKSSPQVVTASGWLRGNYAPEFGLRRVRGKGGHEAAVPLPEVARAIVADYLAKERAVVAVTIRCSWCATARGETVA
jgi:hypothetical protein